MAVVVAVLILAVIVSTWVALWKLMPRNPSVSSSTLVVLTLLVDGLKGLGPFAATTHIGASLPKRPITFLSRPLPLVMASSTTNQGPCRSTVPVAC